MEKVRATIGEVRCAIRCLSLDRLSKADEREDREYAIEVLEALARRVWGKKKYPWVRGKRPYGGGG